MAEDDKPSMNRRSFLRATGAVGAAASLSAVAGADSTSTPDSDRSRELIVGFSGSTSVSAAVSSLPAQANEVHRNENLGYAVVELPSEISTYSRLQIESRIATMDTVRYTHEPREYHLHETPDDPKFSEQYGPEMVRAPKAWEKTEGDDATVAIVDSGVQYDHPDLEDRFGDPVGKDFSDSDSDDPEPDLVQQPDGSLEPQSHGSHVSGIVAASTDNGRGVAGVSNCHLLACKVFNGEDENPQISVTQAIADAIDWASEQGADVINMSLGGGGPDQTVRRAVNDALDSGTLIVASAGNEQEDTGYPAAYDGVIAVSSMQEDGQLSEFSSYGEKTDLTAPGTHILSTVPEDEYGYKSGTSMSSPCVAGVAALARSAHPDMSVTELRNHLKQTAVDVGLPEEKQGAGRVDALKAVGYDGEAGSNSGPDAQIDARTTDPHVGRRIFLRGDVSEDADGFVEEWEWDLGDGTTATGEQVIHTYEDPGEYTVELTVTDDDGATDSAIETITVQSGEVGGETATTTISGELPGGDPNTNTEEYQWQTDEPTKVTFENIDLPSIESFRGTLEGFILIEQGEGRGSLVEYGRDKIELEPQDVDELDTNRPIKLGGFIGDDRSGVEYSYDVVEHGIGEGESDPDPNQEPDAEISVSASSVAVGETVELDASGSSDPDGEIDSYQWSVADGESYFGETASHEFDSAGEHTVELEVTDDDGATDTASTSITVTPSGDCSEEARRTESGTLESGFWFFGDDEEPYTYAFQTDNPCSLTLSLSKDSGPGNLDLYANLDGSQPSPNDADRQSSGTGSNEEISISAAEVSGDEVGILVKRTGGDASYTLEMVELGSEGGSDPEPNEEPDASFTVSTSTAQVGETVEFDASGSDDPDGIIESFEWDFNDGETVTGETATHSYETAKGYTVVLTVTDDDDATGTDTIQMDVQESGGGGSCGSVSDGMSETGTLEDSFDDQEFSYDLQIDEPCQVTVSTDGPSGVDFDLYVTLDGRTPTTFDYDKRGFSRGADEMIVTEDVVPGGTLGILVDSYSGSGEFTLEVEELGK